MEGFANVDYQALQGMMIPYMIIAGIIGIFTIVCSWIINTKAGKPGWAVLIPIYNVIVFLQICQRPGWWFILMLIPLVNIVILIIVALDFLKAFGKPGWHILLLIFFSVIYFAYMAFSKNVKYIGKPAA